MLTPSQVPTKIYSFLSISEANLLDPPHHFFLEVGGGIIEVFSATDYPIEFGNIFDIGNFGIFFLIFIRFVPGVSHQSFPGSPGKSQHLGNHKPAFAVPLARQVAPLQFRIGRKEFLRSVHVHRKKVSATIVETDVAQAVLDQFFQGCPVNDLVVLGDQILGDGKGFVGPLLKEEDKLLLLRRFFKLDLVDHAINLRAQAFLVLGHVLGPEVSRFHLEHPVIVEYPESTEEDHRNNDGGD